MPQREERLRRLEALEAELQRRIAAGEAPQDASATPEQRERQIGRQEPGQNLVPPGAPLDNALPGFQSLREAQERSRQARELGYDTPEQMRFDVLVRHFANGITLGNLDELVGFFSGSEAAAASRAKSAGSRAVAPGTALAGQLLGGAALPLGAARGFARLATSGAVTGGLAGAGNATGTLTERLPEAALGAATGAAFGAAAGGLQALAPRIAHMARNQAAKALGFQQSQLARAGRDEARRVGQVALDEGVLSPFASAETMLGRAEGVQRRAGELLGRIREEVDQISPGESVLPTLRRVAQRLDDWTRGVTDAPVLRRHLNETIQDIVAHADPATGRINAAQLARAKRLLAQKAYSNSLQVPETLGGQLAPRTETARGILQGAEDDLVARVLPERAGEFQRAKDVYGALEKLTNPRFGAIEARANRDLGNNQIFGFTPLVAGTGGAAAFGGPSALGIAAIARLGHQRGNQVTALTANRLARLAASPGVPAASRASALALISQLADED